MSDIRITYQRLRKRTVEELVVNQRDCIQLTLEQFNLVEKDISCIHLPWFYIPCEKKIVAVAPKGKTMQIEFNSHKNAMGECEKMTRTIGKKSKKCKCSVLHKACVLYIVNQHDFDVYFDGSKASQDVPPGMGLISATDDAWPATAGMAAPAITPMHEMPSMPAMPAMSAMSLDMPYSRVFDIPAPHANVGLFGSPLLAAAPAFSMSPAPSLSPMRSPAKRSLSDSQSTDSETESVGSSDSRGTTPLKKRLRSLRLDAETRGESAKVEVYTKIAAVISMIDTAMDGIDNTVCAEVGSALTDTIALLQNPTDRNQTDDSRDDSVDTAESDNASEHSVASFSLSLPGGDWLIGGESEDPEKEGSL